MDRYTILLVHAGASNLKSADQQATAQVAAYLRLPCREPTRITSLASAVPSNNELQSTADIDPNRVARISGSGVLTDFNTDKQRNNEPMSATDPTQHARSVHNSRFSNSSEFIDDTQLAYTALESQLYASSPVALATRRAQRCISPQRLATTNYRDQLGSSKQDQKTERLSPEASQLSETASGTLFKQTPPGHDAFGRTTAMILEWRAMRRHWETAEVSVCRVPAQQVRRSLFRPPLGSEPADIVPVDQIEPDLRLEGTHSSDETTSELPKSYSWGDSTSHGRSSSLERRLQRPNSEPGSMTVGPTAHSGSPPDVTHFGTLATLPESPNVRVRTQQPDFREAVDHQLVAKKILTHAHGTVHHASVTTGENAVVDLPSQPRRGFMTVPTGAEFSNLAAEIHARRPAVSIRAFETHVTKELRAVYDAFGTTYRPNLLSRQIMTHERGHWSMDCTPWSVSKKLGFWRNLQTWIENGTTGWGVWCTRVGDQRLLPSTADRLDANVSGKQETFGQVRLYCWGEIVGHIYVLLYTASEGSVRKLGLQWIDAEGKVVVQMKGRNS